MELKANGTRCSGAACVPNAPKVAICKVHCSKQAMLLPQLHTHTTLGNRSIPPVPSAISKLANSTHCHFMAWGLVEVFERRSFQEREKGERGKENSTLNQYNNNKKSDEKKGCCCAVCVCVQHRFCNLPSATEGHGFLLLFLQIEHHQRETTIERDSIAKRGKRKSLSLRAPRAIFSQTQFEGGRNNSRMRPTCNFAIDPKTYRNKKKKDLQQKKREAASSHHRQLPQSTPAQPQPSP